MSGRGRSRTRRSGERGSALLVIFVFAAIIGIMLYSELPVSLFEARRQKEQLLVDRGTEYKHAVKLYVRKLGTYPASLDALENTNNMRFLRARYVDPFTQKDDWRLLHAGPGGILLDSKVNPANANGDTSSTSSSDSEGQITVDPVRAYHGPAITATVGSYAGGEPSGSGGPDPTASLLPAGRAARMTDNSPAAVDGESQPQTASLLASNGAGSGSPGPSSLGGSVIGGLIAGVASNAKGHSIKVIKKQTDYSLWEFYYDPLTDALPGTIPIVPTPVGVNGTGAPGTTTVTPPPVGAPSSPSQY